MSAKTKVAPESNANGNGKAAKSAPVESKAQLHELDKRLVRLTVKGTTPLIVHAWSEKAVKMMEAVQQQKAKVGREPKNPDAEYEACFYRTEDGRYGVPARAFKKAMVQAATSIDDKRFAKTKIRQVLFVQGDILPLEIATEPNKRCDTVRLNGKTADLRYRPEFKDWSVTLTIEYNAQAVSLEQVVNLLNLAGFAVGIGEWRPEKDGNNGRFEVVTSKGK